MSDVVVRGRGLFAGSNRSGRWRAGAVTAAAALGFATLAMLTGGSPAGATTTWSPPGACGVVQTTTVPANVYSMTATVSGGNGGQGAGQSSGTTGSPGNGAVLQVEYAVAPGDVISAIVGCNGSAGSGSGSTAASPGWSVGGGTGHGQNTIFDTDGAGGGAGGGSSAVCLGSACTSDTGSNPLIVAGGGGGSGSSSCAGTTGGNGGVGNEGGAFSSVNNGTGENGEAGGSGATSGSPNSGISGGSGGVNASGGSPDGGSSPDGSGGADVNVVGGGGGAGYVGGGAGADASTGCEAGGAGGAGSSWYNLGDVATFQNGVGNGGAVLVQFADPTPVTTTTTPPTTIGSPTSWSPGTACGTPDTEVVPTGVYSMTVDVAGGAGGKGGGQAGGTTGSGGPGGEVLAAVPVTPGETISGVVGCAGTNGDGGNSDDPTPTTPGWAQGGGTGQGEDTLLFPTGAAGGGGGGASAICAGAVCTAGAGTPLAVAGGGGGSGTSSCSGTTGGNGGDGGDTGSQSSLKGGSGPAGLGGGSGASSGSSNSGIAGGTGGANEAATSPTGGTSPDGSGGAGVNVVGGGGGGGFVGGGAGADAATGCVAGGAGGGGSSWVTNTATGTTTFRPATVAFVSVTFAAPVVLPPTIGTATTGAESATLTWTAPKATAAPIAGYIVTPYEGPYAQTPQTFTSTATKEVITNLDDDFFYTFTVKTVYTVATSAESAHSNSIEIGVPSTPVLQSAIPGNASAKVQWYPPVPNASPIQTLQITPYVAGVAQPTQVFDSSANSATVTGLTNGTTYTFTISVSNVYGPSGVSNPTAPIVVGVPGAPTSPTATSGSASATVKWTAPPANADPITSYTITPYLGKVAQPAQVFATAATSDVVTGLNNGSAYTFTVTATNSIGTGAASAATAAVTIGVPATPVLQSATPGNGTAKVQWFPPAANAGPITSYTITPYQNGTAQTPQVFNTSANSDVVTGLTNGLSYTFKIAATNSVGTGAQSSPTAAIVVGVPAAVTAAPTVKNGNAGATVTWAAPAANASPITGYTVTPYLAGVAQTPQTFGSSTSANVTGLANGSSYTFKVAASNGFGIGAQSPASTEVTIGLPGQPVLQSATPGNGTAKVQWFPPAANGGPITSYTITPSLAGVAQTPQVFNTSANSDVVTGLTNGSSYTFTIVATNAVGSGPVSPPTAAIVVGIPGALAAAPTVKNGNASVTVSWTAPAANGGPITGYTVTPYLAGVAQTPQTFATSATSDVVTGLTNGSAYTFKVAATNSFGTGALSAASTAITVGLPGQPVFQTATPGNGTATVSWFPVTANGGPITSYTITPYLAGVAQTPQVFTTTGNSDVVTGLTNGSSYTFTIVATNSVGAGPASPATAAIVVGSPNAPATPTGTAGAGQVTLKWVAPANNGSPITGYAVTPYIAGVAQNTIPFSSTAVTEVITGLTSGTAYTFKVAAINAMGTSPTSPASAAITPT